MSTALSIDAQGYFVHRDRRLFPVGVNYWPASSGLHMWANWDADEIDADLDLIVGLGFNTVRFFLRWQDFEPEAGRYADRSFERLEWLLSACAARGLWAHPSLFSGWMSGSIFWPAWKGARNLYADPVMASRAEAFARRAARTFARHCNHLLAVDLGNEMGCLPDSAAASFGDIAAWCARVCAAIKETCPHVMIVSGCDMGQVTNDTGWAFTNQPGTDFLSMHAYPVANWSPVPLGGLDDALSRRLFPYYCAYARAYGPVLFQEFGTILTFGDAVQRDFLAAALPATAAEGVNGMLWWCLRDIRSLEHPYRFCEMERSLGLVDPQGRPKPALAAATHQLAAWAADPESLPPRTQPDLVFYLPDHTQPTAPEYLRPPNPQRQLGRRYLIAWHLAAEAGATPGFARRATLPTPGSAPLLFVGQSLSPEEIRTLHRWVEQGGQLILHGVSVRNWGATYAQFLGAHAVNYALNCRLTVDAFGHRWSFPPTPDEARFVVEPTTARVLARDQDGHPCLLSQQHGLGRILYSLPSVEEAVIHDRSTSLAHGDRWREWYAAVLVDRRLVSVT